MIAYVCDRNTMSHGEVVRQPWGAVYAAGRKQALWRYLGSQRDSTPPSPVCVGCVCE